MIVLYKGHPDSWGGVYYPIVSRLEHLRDRIEFRSEPGPSFSNHRDIEVLIPTSAKVDECTIGALPKLRLIQQAGAGMEGIDLQAARAKEIAVANVPTDVSGAARAVAEHALGLMLALARRYRDYGRAIESRSLGTPVGSTLFGKTVGIIGFGAIGRHLADLLRPFGVSIIAISRSGTRKTAASHIRCVRPAEDLPYLLRESDVVVLACPLNRSTYRMIGSEALNHCKKGVCIINVSRGGLLDPKAALAGLSNGRIAGLGLDVFDPEPADPMDPLITHPNTLSSPHVAAATVDVVEATAAIVAGNIERVLGKLPPLFEMKTC